MQTLVERIKEAARAKALTLSELADRAGIARQTIYYWSKGREPDPETLRRVAAALDTTAEQLLRNDVSNIVDVRGVAEGEPVSRWHAIKRLTISFSAGGGSEPIEVDEREDPLYQPADFFHRYRTTPERCRTATVDGDSMEPTLHDGDEVIFEREACPESAQIRDGRIYVFYDGQGLKVKRLSRLRNGDLLVRSDNEAYKDETIPAEEQGNVRIYGRVLRQIHNF